MKDKVMTLMRSAVSDVVPTFLWRAFMGILGLAAVWFGSGAKDWVASLVRTTPAIVLMSDRIDTQERVVAAMDLRQQKTVEAIEKLTSIAERNATTLADQGTRLAVVGEKVDQTTKNIDRITYRLDTEARVR